MFSEIKPLNDPYWESITDGAQAIGGLATAGGAIVGALSLLLIMFQVWFSARASRGALALETHREYIKLCIEYPELSSTEVMLRHLKRKSFSGILKWNPDPETEKALWFFSYTLNTMEQNLETTSFLFFKDRSWTKLIRSQLSYNILLLREVWPDWKGHYGNRMKRFVDDLLEEASNEG